MAAGRAIVASRPALARREVLRHGENALLVPPGDAARAGRGPAARARRRARWPSASRAPPMTTRPAYSMGRARAQALRRACSSEVAVRRPRRAAAGGRAAPHAAPGHAEDPRRGRDRVLLLPALRSSSTATSSSGTSTRTSTRAIPQGLAGFKATFLDRREPPPGGHINFAPLGSALLWSPVLPARARRACWPRAAWAPTWPPTGSRGPTWRRPATPPRSTASLGLLLAPRRARALRRLRASAAAALGGGALVAGHARSSTT